ncbi:MAG: HAD family hydrolase [Eubacterium sp.]|nr:HAD family hydrolase [Eubacterium sp.]
MCPEAILFDVDDTLYDCQWPFNMAVHEIFQGKYDAEIDRIYRRSRYWTDLKFVDYCEGKISTEDYYCLRNQNAFADFGIAITREEALAVMDRYKAYQEKIAMSDTIQELLRELRRRYIFTGVISNGVSAAQWKKIETLKIPDYIDRNRIIVSGDVGVSKPDPEIYGIACRRLELTPEEVWYVGDNYVNDVTAAAQAGLHTIWFNRKRFDQPATEIRPDCTVYDETELARLLQETGDGSVSPLK